MAAGISLPQPDPTNNMEVWTHAAAQLSAKTLDSTKKVAELSVNHKKQIKAVSQAVASTQNGENSLSSIDAKLDSGNKQNLKFHKENKQDKVYADEKMFKNLKEWSSSAFSKVGAAIKNDTTDGISQFKKGWSELFSGLGELGPLVGSMKSIFSKVRAVFDIFIGSARAIWGGLKWALGMGEGGTGTKVVDSLNYKEQNGDSSDDSDRPEGETDVKPIPLPVLVAGYTDKAEAYQKAFNLEEEKRHNELILLDARGNKIEKEQLKQEKEQTKVQKKIHKRQWLTALMMFAKWGLILAGILAIWQWLKNWWNGDDTHTTSTKAVHTAAILRGASKTKTFRNTPVTPGGLNLKPGVAGNLNLLEDPNNKYTSRLIGPDNKPITQNRFKWPKELGPEPKGWANMSPEVQKSTFERTRQAAIDLEIKNRTSVMNRAKRFTGGALNVVGLGLVADAEYDRFKENQTTTQMLEWHYDNDKPLRIVDSETGEEKDVMITKEMMDEIYDQEAAINAGNWAGIATGILGGGSAWATAFSKQWATTVQFAKDAIWNPNQSVTQNLTGWDSKQKWYKNFGFGKNNIWKNNFFSKKLKVVPYAWDSFWNIAPAAAYTAGWHGVGDEAATRIWSWGQGRGAVNPSEDFLHYFNRDNFLDRFLDSKLGVEGFVPTRKLLGDTAWTQLLTDHVLPAVEADEQLNAYYKSLKTDEERMDFYNQVIPIMMDHSANVDNTIIAASVKDKWYEITLEENE